jgi:dethiobiotin synthetase
MRGVFVAGTDTGVGKTVVAAAIAAALRERGEDVRAFKPVLTGLDDPGPYDHELLAAATGQDPAAVVGECFGPAVSPHLAAALAGVELDLDAVVAAVPREGTVVCEGVGGLLVPLSERADVRALAQRLGLPVVIAARPGLGTINHTLLTLEAARTAGLDVRAVVLTPWPDSPSVMEESNRSTIASLGAVEVATLGLRGQSPQSDLPVERWIGDAAPARPRIDHVVIAVSDWQRSNAFYRDVCLAELVRLDDPPPTRWRYRFGGQQLNVHGPGMDPAPVARIRAAPGMADLCLVWHGPIADAIAHLERHGVAVEDGPVPRNCARGPGLSVYFRDPDGARLELLADPLGEMYGAKVL